MLFKQGEEVKGITFGDGGILRSGSSGCDRITVSMENGQMAGVPWFEVWVNGKVTSKWNGALCEGVLYE